MSKIVYDLTDPPGRIAAPAFSDSADLAFETNAIMIGVAGNVAVMTPNGDTVTLTGLQVGVMYPMRVKRIMATNTTVTASNVFCFGV